MGQHENGFKMFKDRRELETQETLETFSICHAENQPVVDNSQTYVKGKKKQKCMAMNLPKSETQGPT